MLNLVEWKETARLEKVNALILILSVSYIF
jgi:hypothetical protein